MTRIWLVRHAPTHAKAAIGWTDMEADLSDTAALDRLDAHLPRPARLISSDLKRATATAAALSRDREVMSPKPDLREVHFGDWEGLSFEDIARRDPARSVAFWEAPATTPAPGGEALGDVAARVGPVLEGLAGADEDIVVVCHMGAILAALAHTTAMPLPVVMRFVIAPLSVTRVTHLGRGGWRVDSVNHVL